jgi:hypothetical protein
VGVLEPPQELAPVREPREGGALSCGLQSTCLDEFDHGLELAGIEPDAVVFADVDDHPADACEDLTIHELPARHTRDVADRSGRNGRRLLLRSSQRSSERAVETQDGFVG